MPLKADIPLKAFDGRPLLGLFPFPGTPLKESVFKGPRRDSLH